MHPRQPASEYLGGHGLHWKARGDATRELHSRFLQSFTQALIARDVFRTLLGPAHRDHADHLHFDMAPEDYIDL